MNKNVLVAVMAAFAAFFGSVAHADTLLIERHSSSYDFGGTNFRFDEQSGRAWMEVHLSQDMGYDVPIDLPRGGPVHSVRRSTVYAPVAGLSYDAAAAQIVFAGQTGKYVCATVTEKSGFFGRKWLINLTGSCRTFMTREGRSEAVYFQAK